jgi:entry exclusion lipoprotein TrbK
MKLKINIAFILAVAVVAGGCNQNTEVSATSCEQLGKTSDPKLEAELKEKCGHGGPEFKPTPKTREF